MHPTSLVRVIFIVFGFAHVANAATEPPPQTCGACANAHVSMASSPNPSKVGAPVTFTVTVTGHADTLYGSLRDYMRSPGASDPVPGCPEWAVPPPGPKTVQCVTSEMTVGRHLLNAIFPSIGMTVSDNGRMRSPRPAARIITFIFILSPVY